MYNFEEAIENLQEQLDHLIEKVAELKNPSIQIGQRYKRLETGDTYMVCQVSGPDRKHFYCLIGVDGNRYVDGSWKINDLFNNYAGEFQRVD